MKLSHQLSLALLAIGGSFAAQQINHNDLLWLHYLGRNKVSDHLSIGLEATLRLANHLDQKQQYFIRPFVDYQCTPNLVASAVFRTTKPMCMAKNRW